MYSVELLPSAAKQLAKLERAAQRRLATGIDRLRENRRAYGARKLAGGADKWRLRIGDFRILYQIEDDRLIVLVIRIAHRRDARLTPLTDRPTSLIEQMLADGRIAPAPRQWEDLRPPLPPLHGKPLSKIVEEMRDEDPR